MLSNTLAYCAHLLIKWDVNKAPNFHSSLTMLRNKLECLCLTLLKASLTFARKAWVEPNQVDHLTLLIFLDLLGNGRKKCFDKNALAYFPTISVEPI